MYNNIICEYGCGQEAKRKTKEGKWCCSDNIHSCPENMRRNSEKQRVPFTKQQLKRMNDNIENLFELDNNILNVDNIDKKRKIKVRCIECKEIRETYLQDYLWSKTFYCRICSHRGDRNAMANPIHYNSLLEAQKTRDWSYLTEEWKEQFSIFRTGENNPMFGKKQTEESKSAISESHKKKFLDPVFCKIYGDRFNISPNKPERLLIDILNELKVEFTYSGDFSIMVGGKSPDFINQDRKKIIEFFGIYWHGEERTGQKKEEHERNRIEHFLKYGYDTLIIWEDELNNIEGIKYKIIKFNEEETNNEYKRT